MAKPLACCSVTAAVGLLVLLSMTAGAATIVVDPGGGGDYTFIQPAVTAAATGDTVLVRPGTYTGVSNRDIDFAGKGLSLIAEGGSPVTIIDCQAAGRGFNFHSGEGSSALVRGFTIYDGRDSSWGGGIQCIGSSPRIEDCVISYCYSDDGGGILCFEGADASFIDCTIDHCSAAFGGGVFCERSSPSFESCTFSGNGAAACGGGFFCHDGSYPVVSDCVFSGNYSDDGGAMFVYSGTPVVTGCMFTQNHANFGGALFFELPSPTIDGCTFVGNTATLRGGAMFMHQGTAVIVQNCTLVESGAPEGGGLFCYGCTPVIMETIIVFGQTGPAIGCEGGAVPEVTCSDIFDNAGGDWIGCIADQYGVAGNISTDPVFCGDQEPDQPYSLDSASPCVAACGTMGAWGVGCGGSPVEELTWGHLKSLYR